MIARYKPLFSSLRFAVPSMGAMLSAAAAFVVIGALSFGLLKVIENQREAVLADVLSARLNTTVAALNQWTHNRSRNIQTLAQQTDLSSYLAKLDKLSDSPSALKISRAQAEVRRVLGQEIIRSGYLGYFLINRERISIASLRNENIGTPNLLADQDWFFETLDSGKPAISHIVVSDIELPDRDGELKEGLATMFAGVPITDSFGEVTGYLTARIAVTHEFSDLLRSARVGLTGETYAFNREGLMLSESLFQDQLHEYGLLEPGQHASLNLYVRDPGIDLTKKIYAPHPTTRLPLTRMAASAVRGESGIDVSGYRDFRGVPVVGVWRWLDDFNMGIATETERRRSIWRT